MAEPTLKLVDDRDVEVDVLPMERRKSTRHALTGRVTALQQTDLGNGQVQNRICSLQLLDMSETGLGCLSQEPLDADSRIVVFFPPHGPERGFDMYGKVVRCIDRGPRCEIGIEFDHRLAA